MAASRTAIAPAVTRTSLLLPVFFALGHETRERVDGRDPPPRVEHEHDRIASRHVPPGNMVAGRGTASDSAANG